MCARGHSGVGGEEGGGGGGGQWRESFEGGVGGAGGGVGDVKIHRHRDVSDGSGGAGTAQWPTEATSLGSQRRPPRPRRPRHPIMDDPGTVLKRVDHHRPRPRGWTGFATTLSASGQPVRQPQWPPLQGPRCVDKRKKITPRRRPAALHELCRGGRDQRFSAGGGTPAPRRSRRGGGPFVPLDVQRPPPIMTAQTCGPAGVTRED